MGTLPGVLGTAPQSRLVGRASARIFGSSESAYSAVAAAEVARCLLPTSAARWYESSGTRCRSECTSTASPNVNGTLSTEAPVRRLRNRAGTRVSVPPSSYWTSYSPSSRTCIMTPSKV